MNETKKGTNIIFSQNEENRKNYLFSENEKRAYIYSFASLTHADASFCRKGHLMMPLSQNKASRGNSLFSKKKRGGLMKIFLLIDPPRTTAQMQKIAMVNGKPRIYKPSKVLEARNILIKHLRPFKPKETIQGPVELKVTWLFPRGKNHKHNEWKVTKPDTDNLQKMLKDCMTQLGFWNDDAQVVKETCEKRWSNEPCGISIEILSLEKIFIEGG